MNDPLQKRFPFAGGALSRFSGIVEQGSVLTQSLLVGQKLLPRNIGRVDVLLEMPTVPIMYETTCGRKLV
jgi:hypothetical protein